ncbi:hypothetical protein K435DRAFT_805711 [Dendrothele bispora CBS 962.96]|uniref:Uncharacterized protein n=1 Tax=Dendrothele bispora (strain CBS 962.96) TaxID=1314807 RepID=A0A4S8LA50_DENBC|nr:hypothetical protein K435DRAFT_805711 [Dendrothele bispora CBS 962.96]
MSSPVNSTALVLRSRFSPITHLENAFGIDNLISIFLQSKLGFTFAEQPLAQNAVQVILNRHGNVRYTLTPSFADKLLEKIGIVIGILSAVISQGGSYPAPIPLPNTFPNNSLLTILSDVNKLTEDSFHTNPLRELEAVSIQALEEFLGAVNFLLVQYCKWIYVHTKRIVESGGSVEQEVANILFMPNEVIEELAYPYTPDNAAFI